MSMGNQPSQQLLLFAQSILLGLSAGVLYDLLRPFRLKLPWLTHLMDCAYCLMIGTISLSFILNRGEGELRGFVFLGMLGGAMLFFSAFSRWLRPVWEFWADTVAFLVHLLAIPVGFTKNFCKKMDVAEKISFILQGNTIQ